VGLDQSAIKESQASLVPTSPISNVKINKVLIDVVEDEETRAVKFDLNQM
jgi:hypothetical protein